MLSRLVRKVTILTRLGMESHEHETANFRSGRALIIETIDRNLT